ncbi:MAG TPA: hypothetical protein VF183_04710 [Acidimicrobiales bacterium]
MRRRRGLGAVKVQLDRERIAEMREDPRGFYRGAADRVNRAACAIVGRGDGFGRKAFLADVAAEVGVPMKRLGPMLAAWNNLGWVDLSRADLVGGMDAKKVKDSELEVEGKLGSLGRFHFVEAGSARCDGLSGARRRRRR